MEMAAKVMEYYGPKSKILDKGVIRIHLSEKRKIAEEPFERTGSLLHIHAPASEYVAKLVFKQRNGRHTFFFCACHFFKSLPTGCLEKNL